MKNWLSRRGCLHVYGQHQVLVVWQTHTAVLNLAITKVLPKCVYPYRPICIFTLYFTVVTGDNEQNQLGSDDTLVVCHYV